MLTIISLSITIKCFHNFTVILLFMCTTGQLSTNCKMSVSWCTRIRDDNVRFPEKVGFIFFQHDDPDAHTEDAHHVYSQRNKKHEEEAVVSPANAVIYPWAVMVKGLKCTAGKPEVSHIYIDKVDSYVCRACCDSVTTKQSCLLSCYLFLFNKNSLR